MVFYRLDDEHILWLIDQMRAQVEEGGASRRHR